MSESTIVLVNLGLCSQESNAVLPPLGIMSIAGYLRERFDVNINLINQRESNCTIEELVASILSFSPDIIGIGGGTNNALAMADLVKKIQDLYPNLLILIGGPHISAVGAETALKDIPADIAISGEGEIGVELVLSAKLSGSDFSSIPGLVWRTEKNSVQTNPGALPIIEDLDALPYLSYDLIDLQKYWRLESMSSFFHVPYAALSTSRGCPYQCIYCHRIHGKKFRAQSAERIVNEIESLVEKYNIRQIEILDDIFNLEANRVLEFCTLMVRRNLNVGISFPNGIRTDLLTEEIIDALVSAGMNYCSFALETGSPRVQQICGKRLDINKFLHAVELSVQRGVFARGFTILGHPTETASEIEETINVACNSKLHSCLFFTATPFPGTEMYQIAQKRHQERLGEIAFENADYHSINANLSDVSDDELRAYVKQGYRRFYSSPSRMYRIVRDAPTKRQLFWGGCHVTKRLVRGMFRM